MGVATSGTAVLSSVAASTSSVPLLSANSNRVGATVYNDSSATLFVAFAASASLTSFTVKIVAGAYFEVPYWYSGLISGIWDAANGAARLTELV